MTPAELLDGALVLRADLDLQRASVLRSDRPVRSRTAALHQIAVLQDRVDEVLRSLGHADFTAA